MDKVGRKRRAASPAGRALKRARAATPPATLAGRLTRTPYIKKLMSMLARSMEPFSPQGSAVRVLRKAFDSLSSGLLSLFRPPSAECDSNTPDWTQVTDISYQVLDFLDAKSLAQLAGTCKELQVAVQAYARYRVARDYGGIPIGKPQDKRKYAEVGTYPLAALQLLSEVGDMLARQVLFQPDPDYLEKRHSVTVLRNQHVTRHMRAILVDWMMEVASEYQFLPRVVHRSVHLLDRCLSVLTVPRPKLQLLASVSFMIESQRVPGKQMDIENAVYVSASQYNGFQVASMFNLVIGNTQHPLEEQSGETVYEFLERYLTLMGRNNLAEARALPLGATDEGVVLANFVADLSLLDYHLLSFYPSTLAAAVLFYSRMTLHHWTKQHVFITSEGVVQTRSRERLQLFKSYKPLSEPDRALYTEPWGLSTLRALVLSSRTEQRACASCIHRLWLLHQDYLHFVSGKASSSPHVLRPHSYLLKGVIEKYAPANSQRASAWGLAGCVSNDVLSDWVSRHLRLQFKVYNKQARPPAQPQPPAADVVEAPAAAANAEQV